ncbi:MAG: hypothetical protein ACR2GN_09075 [Bacteroidia bacterium]
MYPNSNFIRNTYPVYPGIANYKNIIPIVEEKKEENFESMYGIFDEELDSIDLCEFISPGFISFPGKNGGFYGQDPTQDPNTPQPGQPGQQPQTPGQPGRQQPEIPDPNQPKAPPEHPGQVQPNREIDRPMPPVVPPTSPPNTPQHGMFH